MNLNIKYGHRYINNYNINNGIRLDLLNLPKGKYFPPPSFIEKVVKYQDVNNDKNLRKNVTNDFYKNIIKTIKKKKKYKSLKKHLKTLTSDKGYKIIYDIIRLFVKNTNMNWYDLRDKKYNLVSRFILHKLKEY